MNRHMSNYYTPVSKKWTVSVRVLSVMFLINNILWLWHIVWTIYKLNNRLTQYYYLVIQLRSNTINYKT